MSPHEGTQSDAAQTVHSRREHRVKLVRGPFSYSWLDTSVRHQQNVWRPNRGLLVLNLSTRARHTQKDNVLDSDLMISGNEFWLSR